MSNLKIQNIVNNLQGKDNEQMLMKRSLPIGSLNNINNKKICRSTSRRFKTLQRCGVCEGDAYGFNFDAITCESCKAFFRRNGKLSIEGLKCCGKGHCNLKFDVKNRCKKCRLEKCLATGMRKEWILTNKEKEEKRARVEENRRLRQIHYEKLTRRQLMKLNSYTAATQSVDLSGLFSPSVLNEFDWSTIRSIQNYYINAIRLNEIIGISSYPLVQSIQSTLDLFRIPLYISSMRLITYIKQTNEFQQLTLDDRLYLIKQNLLTVCFFHSLYIYDSGTDWYHDQNSNDPIFSGEDWNKTLNKQFHIEMKQIRNDLINIFEFDDIIIKLFLLILLLSNQISSNQSSTYLLTNINSLNIFKSQNIFVDLLYKYFIHQYGSIIASVMFTRYIQKIFKIQQLVDEIKHTINDYMDVTRTSSLIKSLFS